MLHPMKEAHTYETNHQCRIMHGIYFESGSCARQDTTPSLTAADTTDTQMGRWVESRVDLGGEQLISYPTQLADGTIVLYTGKVGEDSIEDYTRRTSTDGTNWTSEPAALTWAMRWSRGSSLRRTVSRRLSPMTGRMPGCSAGT